MKNLFLGRSLLRGVTGFCSAQTPEGVAPDDPSKPDYIVSDDAWFWQSPYNE